MNQIVYTPELVKNVVKYLQTKQIPDNLSIGQFYRFKKRFGSGEYTLQNGRLYYKDLVVVDTSQLQDLLQRIYNSPETTQNSPMGLYNKVKLATEGISYRDCENFINKQRPYVIMRKPVPKYKKGVIPIISNYPKQLYEMDFIDMSKFNKNNKGIKFVLNIIDHFSKYAWSFPFKSRDTSNIISSLNHIIDEYGVSRSLRADNEFKSIALKDFYKIYGIVFKVSEPYHPQTNGCIERFNQTLKHKIYQMMKLYNNVTYVDYLDKLLFNYNRSIHSAHKIRPIDVMIGDTKIVLKAREITNKYRKTKIYKKGKEDVITIGTSVVISTQAVTELRKSFLLNFGDKQSTNWTTRIEIVEKAIPPKKDTDNWLYKLKDSKKLYQRFELHPVPPEINENVPKRPIFNEEIHKKVVMFQRQQENLDKEMQQPLETRAQK